MTQALVAGHDRADAQSRTVLGGISARVPYLLKGEALLLSWIDDELVRLGGDLCQGYLFARPDRGFPIPKF